MAPIDRTTPPLSCYARKFWNAVHKTETCWLYTGAVDKDGYGVVWVGRNRRAHRFSYEVSVGPIQEGLMVLHKCDTPACVRPSHLFLGTQLENMRDRNAKGRHGMPSGERHWNKSLTQEQADRIRELVTLGWSYSRVSNELGTSPATISRLIHGRQRKGIR